MTRPQERPERTVVGGARFRERVAAERKRRRRRAGVATFWFVLVTAAAVVLLWSPVLALDLAEVRVQGEGPLVAPGAAQAVVARHEGTPLPRLDTVGLRRELLEIPGVRDVRVARVWPRGLDITIQPREPVAAVAGPDGYALLDVEAVAVGTVAEPPPGLPVVSVPVAEPRVMTAVLTVLEQIPVELAQEVAEASAQTQDTVRLVLTDGSVVEWGSADQSQLKARVLATLRSVSRDVTVYDVSAPTMPITRRE